MFKLVFCVLMEFFLFHIPAVDDMGGSKAKLLIKNILADKKAVLEFFFQFLNSTGTWLKVITQC